MQATLQQHEYIQNILSRHPECADLAVAYAAWIEEGHHLAFPGEKADAWERQEKIFLQQAREAISASFVDLILEETK